MSGDKVFGAFLVRFLHVIDLDNVGVMSILGFLVSGSYADILQVLRCYSRLGY
jgi:hypothetical protein